MKKVWHELKDYVYIILAVVIIRTFIVTPAIVEGSSMDKTLEDGQLVFINKFIYRFSDIERNDIVVLKNVADKDKIIKRVIGLPGETVQIIEGYVYINNSKLKDVYDRKMTFSGICEEPLVLGEDEYFVLGDNREVSKDSRILGVFKSDDIIGKVNIRVFPLDQIGKIE